MLGIVLTQIRATWKRTLAVVVAVMIGVAFISTAFLAGNLIDAQLENQFGNQVRGADIVLTSNGPEISDALVSDVTGVDGVSDADSILLAYGHMTADGGGSFMALGQLTDLPEVREKIRITEGRIPESPGEIIITESTQSLRGASVGDSVAWEQLEAVDGQGSQFTVVGVFDGGPSLGLNAVDGFVLQEDFEAATVEPMTSGVLIVTEEGDDAPAVREAIATSVGDGYRVQTFEEYVDFAVDRYSSGALQVQILIGVFAIIAMFSAAIVIANTFQITIAQRTRDLALMRCVGAVGAQVRRSVIIEALLLGAAASAIGVALGVALAFGVNQFFFAPGDRADLLAIGPGAVTVPIVVGTIVTMAAALKPAQSATRVHPLQAIRNADAPVETERVGRIRLIGAAVLNVTGLAGLGGGVYISRTVGVDLGIGILVGVGGGMISFLGVLVAARIIIPPVLSLLGQVARKITGIPGELATTNLQRNPGRTSSTSAALLMGVTLVTMCIVGVSTMKSTMEAYFDERAVVDLDYRALSEEGEPIAMPSEVSERIEGIDGVSEVAAITNARATASSSDGSEIEFDLLGIDPERASVVSRSERIEVLRDDTIILSESLAMSLDLESGETLHIEGESGARPLTVVVETLLTDEPIVTAATLSAISGPIEPAGLWIRLDEEANVGDVTASIQDVIPQQMSVQVGGSAHDRESNLELMDQILLVAMGLLGAAVLIAVIGVGNTLTLSVLERSRESGMLRAMGLTASQLWRTLAVEGVLLALVGALIGAITGVVYGWAGALTLFGNTFPVDLGFPVGQMLMVAGAAFVCGLLASVLPARRALAVSPVEAIATVG